VREFTVVGDERDKAARGGEEKEKKLTSRPHISVGDSTFYVSGPNRKWVGPIHLQSNKNWTHPVPETRDRIVPPQLNSQPNATYVMIAVRN
jgi:hypothetical protein